MANRNRVAFDWKNYTGGFVNLSVYKSAEGGPGYFAMVELADKKIPAQKGYSPYVGQVGIAVPIKFQRRAERVLYG